MTHCSCCNRNVMEAAPSHGYWGLIVAFWTLSLLFGVGAGAFMGWSFMLVLMWVLFATITATFVQSAASWSCPECAATLAPPPTAAGHA